MMKIDNARMSVADECPMCGNAETCESCGGPWPKNAAVPSGTLLDAAKKLIKRFDDAYDDGLSFGTIDAIEALRIAVAQQEDK